MRKVSGKGRMYSGATTGLNDLIQALKDLLQEHIEQTHAIMGKTTIKGDDERLLELFNAGAYRAERININDSASSYNFMAGVSSLANDGDAL